MPKIEITAESDYSVESYKKAAEMAKNRMDNLEAERDKAVAENKQLLAKLMDANNVNAELTARNRMLFESNEAFQKELVLVKEELTKANDALAKTKEYSDSALSLFNDDFDFDCDNCDEEDCGKCDRSITKDTAVDETIDYLIRKNLDYEGQLKAYRKVYRDVIYIMCNWLRGDIAESAEN